MPLAQLAVALTNAHIRNRVTAITLSQVHVPGRYCVTIHDMEIGHSNWEQTASKDLRSHIWLNVRLLIATTTLD